MPTSETVVFTITLFGVTTIFGGVADTAPAPAATMAGANAQRRHASAHTCEFSTDAIGSAPRKSRIAPPAGPLTVPVSVNVRSAKRKRPERKQAGNKHLTRAAGGVSGRLAVVVAAGATERLGDTYFTRSEIVELDPAVGAGGDAARAVLHGPVR